MAVAGRRWSEGQVRLLGSFWIWFSWIHVEHPNMSREGKVSMNAPSYYHVY
jgi:hypothetical protein